MFSEYVVFPEYVVFSVFSEFYEVFAVVPDGETVWPRTDQFGALNSFAFEVISSMKTWAKVLEWAERLGALVAPRPRPITHSRR